MRWVTGTAVVGTILAGSVAAAMAVGPGTIRQDKGSEKEKDKQKIEREAQIRVRPQIEVFGVAGPEIGVTLRELDDTAARERKVPGSEGVLVEEVRSGSPAEKAGIKAGDVIREFDGERVRSSRHLRRLVTESSSGRSVKMVVLRDGKDVTLTVTPRESERDSFTILRNDVLGKNFERDLEDHIERSLPRSFDFRYERPEGQAPGDVVPLPPRRRTPPPDLERSPLSPRWPLYQWSPGAGRLGIAAQELSPQLRDYFGVKEGVLVTTVNPDTPAFKAGLKAGDIITSVNGKGVGSVSELTAEIRRAPDDEDVSVTVVRDRKTQTLKVRFARAGGRPVGIPM